MNQNLPPGVTLSEIEGPLPRCCLCCGLGFYPRDEDQEMCAPCERDEDEGDEGDDQ